MLPHHRHYACDSLAERTGILGREWSRHQLILPGGEQLKLRFAIHTLSSSVSLSRLSYGTEVIVRPEARADVLLVKMPLHGEAMLTLSDSSAAVSPRKYALFDVQSARQMYCRPDLDMLVLRIDYARLSTLLAGLLGKGLEKRLRFSPSILEGSAAWRAWAPVVAALAALQRNIQDVPTPATVLSTMENWVLTCLLVTQSHNYSSELQISNSRAIAPRHVRRAEEFIHAHLSEPIDTATIAAHVGVSVRSLFNSFQSFRGTTPSACLRKARLSAAHDALQCEAVSVVEIAARFGFRSPGHFGEQYKRQYGCSPGATARGRILP